jgi:hypothetical protein
MNVRCRSMCVQLTQNNCQLQLRHRAKERWREGARRQRVCLSMFGVTENIFPPFNIDTIGGIFMHRLV